MIDRYKWLLMYIQDDVSKFSWSFVKTKTFLPLNWVLVNVQCKKGPSQAGQLNKQVFDCGAFRYVFESHNQSFQVVLPTPIGLNSEQQDVKQFEKKNVKCKMWI